jgi:hypothetical protein
MSNDALKQFLDRMAELKRNLVTYEAGSRADARSGGPGTTEIRIQAARRDIAEYERAITALIPRRQQA